MLRRQVSLPQGLMDEIAASNEAVDKYKVQILKKINPADYEESPTDYESALDTPAKQFEKKLSLNQVDPAIVFLAAEDSQQRSHKRQRLNSGSILSQFDGMEVDYAKPGKGYRILTLALGLMCSSCFTGISSQRAISSQFSESKFLGVAKDLDSDFERRLTKMNLVSNESSLEKIWESSSDKSTATLMKNIQRGIEGPLSGFAKKLISGNYSRNTTDDLIKKANFYFWMSPSHSTLRLLRGQSSDEPSYHMMH